VIGRTGGKKTVLGEGALSNSPTTMMLGKEHLSGICADCERLQLFFATNMHFFCLTAFSTSNTRSFTSCVFSASWRVFSPQVFFKLQEKCVDLKI
jgi:hypothetical protein